ncbi:TOMM precursor leader peptide-binding protein [Actinokineospora enzanensis]|uniref:TOMM precursor leader peptide-binding protein n=1 Tax=Actinokineospora enzanensis TaxID=155975 RepID=UPI00036D9E8C|nr:TOMM precursor leader peptide-binding protein [Actinokineospora enzanensis]
MAATVRLTRHAGCVGVGAFGHHVVDLLTAPGHRATRHHEDLDQVFAADVDLVTLVLDRPTPSLSARADELAFRHGVAWLPVVVEHPVVRVGPLVRPPHGPCADCFRRRQAQHDTRGRESAALAAAYRRDPGLGPTGHLPHHVRLVAAVARHAMATGLPDGELLSVWLLDHEITTARVLPCHDCPRCGAPGPTRSITAFARLLDLP